jgi:hypothetical protein
MKRHFVIAGTGRAGTSWLVEFLKEAGLDVGSFPQSAYFEDAKAGWERSLLAENNPYVVKDPWLSTYIDKVDPNMIDVLVLPMRHLTVAAVSRIVNERKVIREQTGSHWDEVNIFGHTPGGLIYSLSSVDQERILAVEFYKLLHWATTHNLKIVLLQYPKMVTSFEHVYGRLANFLPAYSVCKAAYEKTISPEFKRLNENRNEQ